MKQNNQQKRNEIVLQRLTQLSNSGEDWAAEIANLLEWMLDEHAENDGFGTERQMDPRGDGRNGYFTMFHVEGVG